MKIFLSIFTSLALFMGLALPAYSTESTSEFNLRGIDVSHWDETIDWSQVHASDINFAYLKASQGTTITDSQFSNYVKGARANGIAVGAYHYAKPKAPFSANDTINQATFFVNTVKASMPDYGDLMPVLDLEETGGLSTGDLAQWARTFSNTVEQLTNRKTMLYVSYDFLEQNGNLNNSLSDLPLWIAYWDQYYGGQTSPDIAGWHQWTAWQTSSKGRVPGINGEVDLDTAPVSLDTLRGSLDSTIVQSIPSKNLLTRISMQVGSTQVILNGKIQQLDVAPFVVQNRTMIPIRFATESLGSNVNWNPNRREVTISMEGTSIVLTVGQTMAKVNGKTVQLDVPSQITNNRTFVPLRFISENLGYHVDYSSTTQTITIY